MEDYADAPFNPRELRIIQHGLITSSKKKTSGLKIDFGDLFAYELDGESDDETVTETTENLFCAHRDLTEKIDRKRRRLSQPKGRGRMKKIKLSETKAQWKRVNTEYIGEVGGIDTMIKKGYKMGLSTGVLGGRGLDQIWYKGSVTDKDIEEVVVVECKGPGAKLSKDQKGNKSGTVLNSNWVLKNATVMSRDKKVKRRKRLGKFIAQNLGSNSVKGLIVSHDKDGKRKVGKMHLL